MIDVAMTRRMSTTPNNKIAIATPPPITPDALDHALDTAVDTAVDKPELNVPEREIDTDPKSSLLENQVEENAERGATSESPIMVSSDPAKEVVTDSFVLDNPNSSEIGTRQPTTPEQAVVDSPGLVLSTNAEPDLASPSPSPEVLPASTRNHGPNISNNRRSLFGYRDSIANSVDCPSTADASVEANAFDFSPPPCIGDTFDPAAEMNVYQGKQLYPTQRPLIEWGRPWYERGQLSPSKSFMGFHNPIDPRFIVFGDSRLGVASNKNVSGSNSLLAWQTNLFFDLKLTGTERFHFNIAPSTQGANNSRYVFNDDEFTSEFNADINFGFFEGDLGAIMGGFTNKTLPFDLPIAIGAIPLVMQNGVWMEDAILGVAVSIPARNSPRFDISNYDITFFAGWDNINSPAFDNNNDVAKMYGMASWIEAMNGYIEADYAFIEDRDNVRDRSYHNIGIGFTRRYGQLVSNSTRVIVNGGQSIDGGPNTADGVLLISENSLITTNPSTILPYFNMFAGFDRPQSAARNGQAGGVLRNTGILFESDNLTGYPTLDSSANETYGAALGLSLMPQDFSQQLILETAFLGVMGDDIGRNAVGDQKGVGFRYQLPLSNSVIFRTDGMYGFLNNSEDISGIRIEIRKKF
jgi:hypothetical protein